MSRSLFLFGSIMTVIVVASVAILLLIKEDALQRPTKVETSKDVSKETSATPAVSALPTLPPGTPIPIPIRPYSEQAVLKALDEKDVPVIFFYAPWDTLSRQTEKDLITRPLEIPKRVIIFKVDYDGNEQLRNKYKIEKPGLFVQVGANGKSIVQWDGKGKGIKTLREHIQL